MRRKIFLVAAFALVGIVCLAVGVLAGYIWGGWHECDRGYKIAVRQICTGEVETVKTNKQALVIGGAGND